MTSEQSTLTNIELLQQVEANGFLKMLLSRGLMSTTVPFYMEIHLQVCAEMLLNGGKKRRAVLQVSERLDVDERTIWNALKQMKAVK